MGCVWGGRVLGGRGGSVCPDKHCVLRMSTCEVCLLCAGGEGVCGGERVCGGECVCGSTSEVCVCCA